MVGDAAQHRDDMVCDGEEHAYYDLQDSFINDLSQSSSQSNFTQNPLAFRNAFGSQDSTPGLLLGGRRKAKEDRKRNTGGENRVAMPIIERCMEMLRNGNHDETCDSIFEETQDEFAEEVY